MLKHSENDEESIKVAKRYYQVSRGRHQVSLEENTRELTKEVIQQGQLAWFFNAFREHVDEMGFLDYFEGKI